ncbi:MAG TPA: hypothetical protein VFF65_13940 [Phycisphaerales bacterium]|nr:hypothetical protein [Phycisphaerales bacterium]
MARWVIQLVTAVAVGAAVSQGVALACYYFATNTTLGDKPLDPSATRLPAFLRGVWPPAATGSFAVHVTTGRTSTTLHCPDPATPARFTFTTDPGPAEYGLYTDSYGWPLRSIVTCRPCVFTSSGNGDHMDIRAIFSDFDGRAGLHLGLDRPWLPKNSVTGLPVPLQPLWGGLAVNTLLYGIPAWAVLFGPGAVRRLRRRRSACVRCGYPLTGGTVCPECGSPVKPPLRPPVS